MGFSPAVGLRSQAPRLVSLLHHSPLPRDIRQFEMNTLDWLKSPRFEFYTVSIDYQNNYRRKTTSGTLF